MREGWKTQTLGDCCDVIAGQSPSGSAYNSLGKGLPFYQGKKEFEDKYIGPPATWTTEVTKRAKANDILMSVRAPVGPVNFATQEICIGRGLAAIRAKAALNQNFLFYFLLSIQSQISGRDGAVFPSISRGEICAIKLPVPPLVEQQRIVAVLDETLAGLTTATANAERNLKNAQELFDSYLNSVFSRKDESWTTITVGEAVERDLLFSPQDGNHGEIHPKKSDYVLSGVPFIMASDLQDGEVNCVDCNFISEKTAASLRKGFAKDGDVLLSHKGTIGRVAILNTDQPFVMLTPQVTYYRVKNTDVLSNEFVRFIFESAEFQSEMAHIAGAGSTRAYIGITKQLDLSISYPPLAEQRRLVSTLVALKQKSYELENVYRQKLDLVSEFRQSILEKAFAGDLTSLPSQGIREAAE